MTVAIAQLNSALLEAKAAFFQKNGYVIFEQAVSHQLIHEFAEEFHRLTAANKPLKVNLLGEITSFADADSAQREKLIRYGRFTDIEVHSELGKQLILHPVVSQFLTRIYQTNKPTSLQSLTYKYSSQQGEHSDLYLVSPDWAGEYDRNYLAASWIALEDASSSNGALIIYPKSHLIPNKKRLDRDFKNNYGEYVAYCKDICAQHGIEPQYFQARKGDILFWHGDFIHAGGEVQNWGQTRFSIVCHYANIDPDHFPLSLANFRCYRDRILYQDLGYFYRDLPSRHLRRDLLKLWDDVLIKQHRTRVKIALARHKTKKALKKALGFQTK